MSRPSKHSREASLPGILLKALNGWQIRLTPGNRVFTIDPNGQKAQPYLDRLGLLGGIDSTTLPEDVQDILMKALQNCMRAKALRKADERADVPWSMREEHYS